MQNGEDSCVWDHQTVTVKHLLRQQTHTGCLPEPATFMPVCYADIQQVKFQIAAAGNRKKDLSPCLQSRLQRHNDSHLRVHVDLLKNGASVAQRWPALHPFS